MKLVRVVVAAVVMLGAATAAAQPLDPYADPPPPGTPPSVPPSVLPTQPIAPPPPAAGSDAEVDEAVAVALVDRARVLQGEGAFADARALVLEAIARRPTPPTELAAKTLLAALNAKLGIVDHPLPPPPPPPPIAPPTHVRPVLDELDEPPPYEKFGSGSRVRFIGSGMVWGAVAGGLFADVVSGLDTTDEQDIGIGAALGAVGGGLIAAGLRNRELTSNDAALIDSTTLWTTEAAFALAFAIAPPETEAYTLNGALGVAGGYLIGHVAARNREVSASRLMKVNALATLGAAAPWLLYAAVSDDTVDDDEQAFGWLSLAGLGAGIFFGFQWTSDSPGYHHADDAPAAMVRRSSRGAWSVGGPALAPVRANNARERGVALTVLGGAW